MRVIRLIRSLDERYRTSFFGSAWHRAHPTWRVVDDAQTSTHGAMLEVPSVTIGGLSTGPVWFTQRSDAGFHGFMSSMTSARVDGSLGGNALRTFSMTIDYPRETPWFSATARR